jgi:hypothetical protein
MKSKYRSAVGSPMYAMICTIAEIIHVVGQVGQFSCNPSMKQWTSMKRIFKYLKGTLDFGIMFNGSAKNPSDLMGYSDADWVHDVDQRKSAKSRVHELARQLVSCASKK